MVQIMKPAVDYPRLPAGMGKRLLDPLEGFSPEGADSVVIRGWDQPSGFHYIISPAAKEDNPWL